MARRASPGSAHRTAECSRRRSAACWSQAGEPTRFAGSLDAEDVLAAPLREPAAVVAPEPRPLDYDILLGVTGESPQYGLLGDASGRRIAIDLNQTHTISLFGVQGGGKSYTLGTLVEMALLPIPKINVLPRPLATVIFHYSPTMDYRPEFTSMIAANTDAAQVKMLKETFGAALPSKMCSSFRPQISSKRAGESTRASRCFR